MKLLILSIILTIINALPNDSCYDCSYTNGGNNYMCYAKGLFNGPHKVACCSHYS